MNAQRLRDTLADVVAIPVTPYVDNVVDLATYKTLLRRLIDNGIRVITPNGNTSEFYALAQSERQQLIRASVEEAGDDAALLVGVGHDVATAVCDARVAQEHGVEMVMIHQLVHPYISADGWLDYHAQIASAVPELGIVLYIKTEVVDANLLIRLVERCPNVIGIKYSLADPTVFGRVRAETGPGRFVWIAGLAEPYALSYAAHGASGFTSGLVNVNPQLSLKLRDVLRGHDYATAELLLEQISRFEELRAANRSANNVSVVKEALFQLGLCDRTIRAPSSELSVEDRAVVADILADWKQRDWLVSAPELEAVQP